MPTPENPFVHSLKSSPLQNLKMWVLGVTLLPLRLFICLICLLLCTFLAFLGLRGLSSKEVDAKPFTGWRLFLRNVVCYILRFMFFCCGFILRIKGNQASSREAPILVVAPHSTFFDSLAVCVTGGPSVVAKAETSSIPFWGSLIRFTQPVLVHRNDPNSRQTTINQISERSESQAEAEAWQQVFIFPEGTCTNRQALITFRLGAFYPGVSVQPVLLRYSNNHDTVTWTWEGLTAWQVISSSLSQFYINISMEYLQPYTPNEQEKEDPKLFAANVRAVMAEAIGIPTTDSSYFDYLRIEKADSVLKNLQKLQRNMNIGLSEATGNVLSFSSSNLEELCSALGISPETEELAPVLEQLSVSDGVHSLDIRSLRIAVLMATQVDAYDSFLSHTFTLYCQTQGDASMDAESLRKICEVFLFLSSKEMNELLAEVVENEVVTKEAFNLYLTSKKPNYAKVLRKWQGGLVGGMSDLPDLLNLTKDLNKKMEKVALSGSSLISAGKDAVQDMSAAGRDLMSEAITSAVTSLHKRTGSRTEPSTDFVDQSKTILEADKKTE